jgi:hypothetical protein
MSKEIRMDERAPRCPLCLEFMVKRFHAARMMFIWDCARDKVGIAVNDPFVNRWEEAYAKTEKILCPVPGCEAPMRFFATSTGYMKAKCPKPKCGACMEGGEPDRPKDEALDVPGIDRPKATPDAPGTMQ